MPKEGFPELKGSICNIPIDSNDTANVLPQGADNNRFLVVKLKRKLYYREHVYFAVVSPEIIYQSLMHLKQRNSLYHHIDIALDNIPKNVLLLTDNTNDQESESSTFLKEGDNPLDLHKFNSQETMLIPNVFETEEIHIAPGEGKQPKSILNDEFCEELVFPYLFPNAQNFFPNVQKRWSFQKNCTGI